VAERDIVLEAEVSVSASDRWRTRIAAGW